MEIENTSNIWQPTEEDRRNMLSVLNTLLLILAMPKENQLSFFPPFARVPVELVADFDIACGALVGNFPGSVTSDQRNALDTINTRIDSLTQDDYLDDGLEQTLWQEFRELAQTALDAFGWPMQILPPMKPFNIQK